MLGIVVERRCQTVLFLSLSRSVHPEAANRPCSRSVERKGKIGDRNGAEGEAGGPAPNVVFLRLDLMTKEYRVPVQINIINGAIYKPPQKFLLT